MNKHLFFWALIAMTLPLFAQKQIDHIAEGAWEQFHELLNRSAMVTPATAEPLGRSWFTLEIDVHVFTDQASVPQVAEVFIDFEKQASFFNGRRVRHSASLVAQNDDMQIVDFVSTTIMPVLNIRFRTPYRTAVRTHVLTKTLFYLTILQLPEDSETNSNIRNLNAQRYAEEVEIDGEKYTYIRIYSISDVNTGLLPRARNTLERHAAPVNEEVVQMVIDAARSR